MTLLLKGINFIKTSIKIIFITFFISLLADFFFGKLILKSLNSYFAKTEFYGKIMRTDHPIFHQKYDFNGLPKIHEHDGKRAQAFGIIENGRVVCLYTYETDLSDGWENSEVHNDSQDKRYEALQMGANILMYSFMQ